MNGKRKQIICKFLITGVFILAAAGCIGCRKSSIDIAEETDAHPQVQAAQQLQMKMSAEDIYTIGVSLPTSRLAFRGSMKELMLAYSEQAEGRRAKLKIYDADGSQKQQNQDILELVDSGVDGIILVPNTTEGCLSAVEYANQKHIPVITVDNQIEKNSHAQVISFVGADHYRMGRDAAELFVNVLGEKLPEQKQWNVIHLTGIPDSSGAIDRGQGILDVLDKEERIHCIGSFNGAFTVENAKSVIEDCLEIYDTIDGVICQNDNMAEGCYQALAEAGKAGTVVVVGIDGQKSTLEIMAQGGIHGTVLQQPSIILKGISLLCDALDGMELNDIYFEPTDIITTENVNDYLENGLSW